MIQLEDVSKYYGPTVGVRDLTFRVERGEIVGLLGPNGAGKTTTMRMITTFMAPTSGSIEVAGYDVIESPVEVRRHIGYLPENAPAYPELTVREYLSFMGEIKELAGSRLRSEVDHAIEVLDLGPVVNRLVANISRGYRQRVGLAQAILGDPELLVLDEPTVGLDPRQIIEIREFIQNLAGERTVLISSHILSEVQQTCERVIVISEGRLVVQDRVDVLAQQLAGGTRLYLTVRGPAEELEKVLGDVDGVEEVLIMDPDPEAPHLALRSDLEIDVREAVFFALAAKRWPILELRLHDYSLEDIYLQLTSADEAASPEVEEAAAEVTQA